jgi:hypothetical protein
MRIRAAIIVALLVGTFAVSGLLVGDRRLESARLERLQTACPDCHGEVPSYSAAAKVHDRHSAFECGRCHTYTPSLKATDRLHAGLEGVLIGIVVLISAGLAANQWIISGKSGRARPRSRGASGASEVGPFWSTGSTRARSR